MEKCSICIEDVKSETRLNCGHIFCKECIIRYERKGGMNCPNCRRPFVITNYMSKQDQLILLKLKFKNLYENGNKLNIRYEIEKGIKYRIMTMTNDYGESQQHVVTC